MNEDAAMTGDNVKEFHKSSYRNLSHCYLNPTIPKQIACLWYWDTAVTGRRYIVCAMQGTDQVFWDVTLLWNLEYPRRIESSTPPLWETETSQNLSPFLSISDTSLTAFCLSLFCLLLRLSNLPNFLPPSTYMSYICFLKTLILLLVSLSQLTPRYWPLLWRHKHQICDYLSLIAMIMAPLCAWADWACWLIHRTLMQPYT